MDNVEEAMLQLQDNPGLLRDPAFRIFTPQRWSCLNPYYQNKLEKAKKGKLLSEIERERIFEVGEECEDLIDQIVICHAKGILDALYHNAHNFLTSCDGCYASGKFNETMIVATEEVVADNILGAESTLGKVDMAWRRGLPHEHS